MSAATKKPRVIEASYVDLVMEGGGVKAAGLVGAVEVLYEHGYQFPRIAGASAGAIVGSLLAAGMPPKEVRRLMLRMPFGRFQDPSLLSRFGLAGRAMSVVLTRGMYKGDALHAWITEQLANLGVKTFKDLKITEEWAATLPPEQRYKLVVMVADVGRGRLLRLPWDYKLLGLNADDQPVAEAIRASASIPFFYQPVKMSRTLLVDGGLLSNFPVDIFDDYSSPVTWPTFGIKLSAKANANVISHNVQGIFGFPMALLNTLINGYDHDHLHDPATTARTIFVDTGKVRATNFTLTRKQRELLHANGKEAAEKFLTSWDYAKYNTAFVEPRIRAALASAARK